MEPPKLPFTLNFASRPDIQLGSPTGTYDDATQTWQGMDESMTTTWCRSSTTGIITSDPDEDKDDER